MESGGEAAGIHKKGFKQVEYGRMVNCSFRGILEFPRGLWQAYQKDEFVVDGMAMDSGALSLLKTTEIILHPSPGFVVEMFPVILLTGGMSFDGNNLYQFMEYFAPVLPRREQGGLAMVTVIMCTDAFQNSIQPNPAYVFKAPAHYWGDSGCEQLALLDSPPVPGCSNFYVKMHMLALIYFEHVQVYPNELFTIIGNWEIQAICISMSTESDLSVRWLSSVAPQLATHGSQKFKDAVAAREAEKLALESAKPKPASHLEKSSTRFKTKSSTQEGPAPAQNKPTGANDQEANPVVAASGDEPLIKAFPSFPIDTLGSGLPVKYAYMLHNFMSHVSYVQQCCLNKYAAVGNMSHCPFCGDNPELCPCGQLLHPGEPQYDFVFPVMVD